MLPRFSTFLAIATACATVATAQTRVQILHASDLEGGVDAVSDAPNFAAVVQGLENQAATRSIPSILLSAGDNYIPGPFFSSAGDRSLRDVLRRVLQNPAAREGEGRVDISIMNVLGFDAAAVGNHEFDLGPSAYRSIVGTDIRNNNTEARWLGAQFPYLSANLDFAQEPALASLFTGQVRPSTDFRSPLNNLPAAAAAPKFAPATIVVRGSERFGIVGATTPILASITSNGGVSVKNPGAGTNDMAKLAQVLQPTIDALLAQNIDKIILVSHLQQFALEQALVNLLKGVDIVIAGGSDTLLADSNDRLRQGQTARGPYPTVSTNADNEPALLLSTAGQYSYVGRLVVSFDANGVVVPTSVNATESGAFITDNQGVIATFGSLSGAFAAGTKGAAVKELTDAVSNVVSQRDGNIVGKADVFLEGRRTPVRTQETNFGDLTALANLRAARDFDPTVQVSAKNGGGIRNPIGSVDSKTGALGPNVANPISGKKAGEVSQLDIENSLRFNNGLTLITLTRAQFKEVLEHAVARTGAGSTPGQFGQFAGVSFSFDPARAAGDRVRFASLTGKFVPGNPVVVADGKVVGVNPIRIVTLDFLAGGGDNYPYPSYVQQNPSFANRVNLRTANLPDGASTFAPAGSEQDALAEFFLANFGVRPYGVNDKAVGDDQGIQQIGTRPEMKTSVSSSAVVSLEITGAKPMSLTFLALGLQAGHQTLNYGAPFGSIDIGVDTSTLFFLGNTDANGDYRTSFQGVVLPFQFVGQGMIVEGLNGNGLIVSTTNATAF